MKKICIHRRIKNADTPCSRNSAERVMGNKIIYCCLLIMCMLLQSFISCREELVEISVKNMSADTLFAVIRETTVTANPGGLDYFEGLRSKFEWKKVAPDSSVVLYCLYLEDKESVNWKIWAINKRLMKGLSLEEVIDGNLLDSVKTYIHTYSYQELKEMDFRISIDERLWE